jgi:hypothetical protein
VTFFLVLKLGRGLGLRNRRFFGMKLSSFLLLFLDMLLFFGLLSMMLCLLRKNSAGGAIVGTIYASSAMLAKSPLTIYSLSVALVEESGGLL